MVGRFRPRRHDKRWYVMDRTTGSPAEFNGKMLTDLDRDDAEILAELLNEVPDPRTAIFRMFGGKI